MYFSHKSIFPICIILLAGCGGVNTAPADVQPISGAPLPNITFSESNLIISESSQVEIIFSVLNSGPAAITRVFTGNGIIGKVNNTSLTLTAPEIELHEIESSITVEVEFGGQKGSAILPVIIRNDSGLIITEQVSHFLDGSLIIGQEDISLAIAVKDISAFEDIDLSNQLDTLKEITLALRTSSELIGINASLLDILTQYLTNGKTEPELREALISSESIYINTYYLDISDNMAPFWEYLNDFSEMNLNTVNYSSQKDLYSRYIGNIELGEYEEQEWVFYDQVNYLSSLLPSIVGMTPCEITMNEDTEL